MLSTVVAAFALALPASPSAGAVVFFVEPSSAPGGSCIARVHDLDLGKTRALFEAPDCPSAVLWSAARDRVIYTSQGKLWIRPLGDTSAKATALGALPAGDLQALYVGGKARSVRAAVLAPVPDKDVLTKGEQTIYRFEGKELRAEGVPPWGAPYVALLLELDGKGSWKRLQAKPTKWEAGDTPGVDVLDMEDRATDVVSLSQRLKEATCVGGALDCDVDSEAIKRLVGATDDALAGVARAGQTPLVAFKVMFGDTPHAVSPVWFCEDTACGKGRKLNVTGDQLGVLVQAGYVLVAEEYTGAAPVLLDGSGKELWRAPRATSAVFFPSPPPWSAASNAASSAASPAAQPPAPR